MKSWFQLAAAIGLILTLASCGSMSRTFNSLSRTFGNYTGGQAPVIR